MGRLIRRVLLRCSRTLDDHLSRDCVTAAFQRPTRGRDEQPHSPLSDLAPGEVYRAGRVTPAAGGLLLHRFTLTPCLRTGRSTFCCTVSRVTPGGCYPPPCSMEPGRSSAPLLVTRSSCRPIHTLSLPGQSRCGDRLPETGFLGAHHDGTALRALEHFVDLSGTNLGQFIPGE
jgi:hypothetical protein